MPDFKPYRRGRRYWADFRALGGEREPLRLPGASYATTDARIAARLVADRLRAYQQAQRDGALLGLTARCGLAEAVGRHLVKKAESGAVTEDWLKAQERMLGRAVAYLGAERALDQVSVADVGRWIEQLRKERTARGPMTSGTLRHHCNALSNLFRRAQAEGWVAPGHNPVAAMMEKPRAAAPEAKWLEVGDAARLLEAARTLPAASAGHLDPVQVHALLATFLLTGGREAEVLGLELDDVSFDRATVRFQPNDWRRLKTRGSARVVPLWPQLEEVLRPYLFGRTLGRLLFPSYRTGTEAMVTDWRKALDRVAVRAGWQKGEIRSRMFRHTYASARLQTTDGGAPVSPFTVSRELGHRSLDMVTRVYGHLGTIRERQAVVEYRVEQPSATLAAG